MAFATIDEAYKTITDSSQFVMNNKTKKIKSKNKKSKTPTQTNSFDSVNLNLSTSLEQNTVNTHNDSYNLVEPFVNPEDIINEYSPLSEEDSDIEPENNIEVEGLESKQNRNAMIVPDNQSNNQELNLINKKNNRNNSIEKETRDVNNGILLFLTFDALFAKHDVNK